MRKTALAVGPTLIIAIYCFLAEPATAQTWTEEQLAVWEVVEASWKSSTEEDPKFFESYLHPDYQGWSTRSAMPIGRSDLERGLAIDWSSSETKFYKLDPVRIVVHGDSAVVHYYFNWFFDVGGEFSSRQARMSQFMVKESGRWMILGSHVSDVNAQ